MRANITFALLNTFFLFLFISNPLQAKKVVCIDDGGDAGMDVFLWAHEGWERQNADDDTVIQVGGSLTDCLAQLEDGDQLVIVAHGFNGGEGFNWGNNSYTGFGDGEGEMPVPDGFDELDNITVDFCTCWSARDPDGADGEDTSLCSKIEEALGDNTTSNGFTDYATSQACYRLKPVEGSGVTNADMKAAKDSLDSNAGGWSNKPPHNRDPEPEDSDENTAQDMVDAKVGAGKVTVCVFYYKPKNTTDSADSDDSADSGGILLGDCGCDGGATCGLHLVMSEEPYDVPDITVFDPTLIPDGVWINPTPWNFLNTDPTNPDIISITNVRIFNVNPPVPLADAEEAFIVDSFFDVFFDIEVGGDLMVDEAAGNGFMHTVVIPMPYNDPAGTQYFETEMLAMSLTAICPLGPIQIQLNPTGGQGGGALSAEPLPTGDFNVDSFFDVMFQIDFDGATAPGCGQASAVFSCATPDSGCTNQQASNFDPCAVFDDGTCVESHPGCTYPGACNYNPNATEEDGSCMFVGCTDPTANNYNPFATHDNGSCSFAIAAVPCPGDINGDGTRDTLDLLGFLAVFGQICE